MNRNQKKRLFQGLLAVGIVLLGLSILLDGRVSDALGGMLCGMGSGLLALAGSTLLNLRHEAKHPEMARQHDIEQHCIRSEGGESSLRLGAAPGRPHLPEPGLRQDLPDQAAERRFVINRQYFQII